MLTLLDEHYDSSNLYREMERSFEKAFYVPGALKDKEQKEEFRELKLEVENAVPDMRYLVDGRNTCVMTAGQLGGGDNIYRTFLMETGEELTDDDLVYTVADPFYPHVTDLVVISRSPERMESLGRRLGHHRCAGSDQLKLVPHGVVLAHPIRCRPLA